MNEQKINLSDFQNDWANYINSVINGREVILTKTDKPVAVITPVKKQDIIFSSLKGDDEKEKGNEIYSQHSEMWIG